MTGNRAAIYCRLSKDDEQCGDSVSIETQKIMLTKYCFDNNFEIFDIYVDDGYSGLNFNRPSFKRLIEDIEKGKIDIVVTKDLSRLGRDYIQTGYYIDVYFVTKHIRYIAVNDGIDTQYDNNDIAPFKNILNDMYAKDLSRKIKSAKQQRSQNGFYTSSQPPYGYKVNPYNRKQLIIDDEAAQIVKMIFDLAEQGNNYSQIARILEKRKIICPSAYKAINGDTRFLKFIQDKERMCQWQYQAVRTILNNPVYVGDMVNHKTETINYKTKEKVSVPIQDRIIVPNTHEAIIDRGRFDRIRQTLRTRKSNHSSENIFKGIVCCAECGEELQLIMNKKRNKEKLMFRCIKHIADPGKCTHNHSIFYDDLYDEVAHQLRTHIENAVASNEYNKLCENVFSYVRSHMIEAQKNKLQKELMVTNKKIKDYYKSSVSITSSSNELEHLLDTRKELMQKITHIGFSSITVSVHTMELIKQKMREIFRSFSLTEKTIKLFVDKIEVCELENIPNGAQRKIKIHYRF